MGMKCCWSLHFSIDTWIVPTFWILWLTSSVVNMGIYASLGGHGSLCLGTYSEVELLDPILPFVFLCFFFFPICVISDTCRSHVLCVAHLASGSCALCTIWGRQWLWKGLFWTDSCLERYFAQEPPSAAWRQWSQLPLATSFLPSPPHQCSHESRPIGSCAQSWVEWWYPYHLPRQL